jgi:hypothetical protein
MNMLSRNKSMVDNFSNKISFIHLEHVERMDEHDPKSTKGTLFQGTYHTLYASFVDKLTKHNSYIMLITQPVALSPVEAG